MLSSIRRWAVPFALPACVVFAVSGSVYVTAAAMIVPMMVRELVILMARLKGYVRI